MTSFFWVFAIASLTLCPGALSAQIESSEDFKSKVMREWNATIERFSSVSGRVHDEFHSTGYHPTLDTRLRLKQTTNGRYGYSRAGYFFEVETERFDEAGKIKNQEHTLFLVNEEYSAELRRVKKGEGWLLANLKMGGPENLYKKTGRPGAYLWAAFPWLVLFSNVWVPEWFPDPSFVITRIEPIQGASGNLSRVHFQYDGSRLKEPLSSDFILHGCSVSGHIDFDDHFSYRIMGYQVYYKYALSEGDRRGAFEYENGGEIPILRVKSEEFSPQYSKKFGGWSSSKSISSYKYSHDSVPSEEFRLSYYDLPEPMGASPLPKSHAYLWLALGAVGAALFAVFLRWMARRIRKT